MSDPWATAADRRAAQKFGFEPSANIPPADFRSSAAPPADLPPVLRSRISLRSVPDGRQPVALLWWVPVVAVAMLTITTVAILPVGDGLGWIIAALGASVIGYAAVWWVIRPGRLRLNPPIVTSVGTESTDVSAAMTGPIPIVPTVRPSVFRTGTVLVVSSSIGLGASAVWALLFGLLVPPEVPTIPTALSGPEAIVGSLLDALITSVLEECGMAVLILAVAGLATRFLPAHFDSRTAGFLAIAAATLVRTLLHVPLWGVGAIGRIVLSFVLAWLFWRTRRVWPLIVAHVLWDTVVLQTLVAPTAGVRLVAGFVVFGWAIAGFVIVCIAAARSRSDFRHQPVRYRPAPKANDSTGRGSGTIVR